MNCRHWTIAEGVYARTTQLTTMYNQVLSICRIVAVVYLLVHAAPLDWRFSR
jgi:hypothetical protein